MPQRRKVRTTTKRPKVTLPDGKEGEDLPEETRQKKLEVLLKDFDDDGQSGFFLKILTNVHEP